MAATDYMVIQTIMGAVETDSKKEFIADVLGVPEASLREKLLLAIWIDACAIADDYCQNTFADFDGMTVDPCGVALPASVQNGVISLCAHLYLRRVMGTSQQSVGDLATSYTQEFFDHDFLMHFGQWRLMPLG